jgi:UDP-glucose 4-epimerase
MTITTPEMTRFLLSLDQAVDTIFAAMREAGRGETYIPRVPSAKVVDIARALIGDRPIQIVFTGIRPGEKVHEILVSEEERFRTVERGSYYVILPMLPELRGSDERIKPLEDEYSSAHNVMDLSTLKVLLRQQRLMVENIPEESKELLR